LTATILVGFHHLLSFGAYNTPNKTISALSDPAVAPARETGVSDDFFKVGKRVYNSQLFLHQ